MHCIIAILYSTKCQRAALNRVIYRRFARKDRKKKVSEAELHTKLRARTKTMEKGMLCCFLESLLHWPFLHTSQLCILLPGQLFCFNIHLAHAYHGRYAQTSACPPYDRNHMWSRPQYF